jgi:hypothetical protein
MSLLLSVVAVLAALLGDADRDVACLVLGGLDLSRAAAFATGDAGRLASVYVTGQAAEPDAAAVTSYRERGVRVIGAVMHRRSCDVVSRSADRIELDVVDRLGPAVAVRQSGLASPLPRDLPTRHQIVLVRTTAGWRIAAVTGAAGQSVL